MTVLLRSRQEYNTQNFLEISPPKLDVIQAINCSNKGHDNPDEQITMEITLNIPFS